MKKTLLVLALLLSRLAFAQVTASQLSLKTNGDLAGDSSDALGLKIYRATSAPSSPQTGQFWLDTTASPPTLKEYNGSSWDVIVSTNCSIVANLASLPGSPSDGQCVFARAPGIEAWYDNTAGYWRRGDNGSKIGSNYVEVYGGTVITAPSSFGSVANHGSGSGWTTGNHSCVWTFANSTGGETTAGTASAQFNHTTNTTDFSSVPTGGTGTTQRRLYCTKSGDAGLRYFVGQINDNTTTTFTGGVVDSSLVLPVPTSNYSAALPAGSVTLAVTNSTTATTSGGCGATATSVACYCSNVLVSLSSATNPAAVRLSWDLSGVFASTNAHVDLRVVHLGNTATSSALGANNWVICAARAGTADNSILVAAYESSAQPWSTGISSTGWGAFSRTSVGGSAGAITGPPYPWPEIAAVPFWMRFVKRGTSYNWYISSDGVLYSPLVYSNSAGNSNTGFNPSSPYDHLELIAQGGTTTVAGYYIEVDGVTFTTD